MTKVKFKEWDCKLLFGQYAGGSTAIQLVDADDGQPIAVATVNVTEIPLPKGYVYIKDWSENKGILDALVNAGVVQHEESIPYNFVNLEMCKLLVNVQAVSN